MKRSASIVVWALVALAGASALGAIAFHRGEPLNATWFVVAAGCCYLVAYRFIRRLSPRDCWRSTIRVPRRAERHEDGRDFVPTNKWILFGHHFAAIAGPGPLVGPTLAAQFGYLPGTLWLIAGAVFAGCVQDFIILFCSIRRDGKTLGEIAREEVSRRGGFIAQTRGAGDHGDFAGRCCAGDRERAEVFAVGDVYAGGDHSHRAASGAVLEISAAGACFGGLVHWRGAGFVCGGGGTVGGGLSFLGACFHTQRRDAGVRAYRVRVCSVRFAGVAAARAARLFECVYQGWRDFFAGCGNPAGAAAGLMPPLTRFIDGSGPVFAGKIFRSVSSPLPAERSADFIR